MARRILIAAVCLGLSLSAGAWAAMEEGQPERTREAVEQEVATPEPKYWQPRAKIDPEARKVLQRISEYFDGLESYSVNIIFTMKMELTGMKTETESTYSVAFKQPNKLAVTTKGPMALMSGKIISDGERVYQYSPILQKVDVRPASPKLGQSFVLMLVTMGPTGLLTGPFVMFDDNLDEVMECFSGMKYMGAEEIGGVECHHLSGSLEGMGWDAFIEAGETPLEGMGWDVWIEVGGMPLPRRLFADMSQVFSNIQEDMPEEVKDFMDAETAREMYKNAKYEMSARFENWKVNPELPEDTFKFTPPEGVEIGEKPGAVTAGNEAVAVATLHTVSAAEAEFRKAAEVDQDGDGTGEYGFLQELLGLAVRRGTDGKASPAYLPPRLLPVNGVIEKSGYYFRLYVPGDSGSALGFTGDETPKPGREAIDLQEKHFVCYAWPKEAGLTGTRAFAVTDDGEIYETRMEKTTYSGMESVPAANALYERDAFLSPRGGSDGNAWIPALP